MELGIKDLERVFGVLSKSEVSAHLRGIPDFSPKMLEPFPAFLLLYLDLFDRSYVSSDEGLQKAIDQIKTGDRYRAFVYFVDAYPGAYMEFLRSKWGIKRFLKEPRDVQFFLKRPFRQVQKILFHEAGGLGMDQAYVLISEGDQNITVGDVLNWQSFLLIDWDRFPQTYFSGQGHRAKALHEGFLNEDEEMEKRENCLCELMKILGLDKDAAILYVGKNISTAKLDNNSELQQMLLKVLLQSGRGVKCNEPVIIPGCTGVFSMDFNPGGDDDLSEFEQEQWRRICKCCNKQVYSQADIKKIERYFSQDDVNPKTLDNIDINLIIEFFKCNWTFSSNTELAFRKLLMLDRGDVVYDFLLSDILKDLSRGARFALYRSLAKEYDARKDIGGKFKKAWLARINQQAREKLKRAIVADLFWGSMSLISFFKGGGVFQMISMFFTLVSVEVTVEHQETLDANAGLFPKSAPVAFSGKNTKQGKKPPRLKGL